MKTFAAIICSIMIGYGFGCINPAAHLSKIKQINLREQGTKNLGASNVTLTLGKKLGAAVMAFDILKAFFAYKLSARLFFFLPWAGIIAGVSAVIGHIFPFYMHFSGGKGLAAFGGLVMAINVWLFVCLLLGGLVLMLIVNQSFVVPYLAAIVAPIWVAIKTRNMISTLLVTGASLLIMWKHFDNLKKALHQEDVDIWNFVRTKVFKTQDGGEPVTEEELE